MILRLSASSVLVFLVEMFSSRVEALGFISSTLHREERCNFIYGAGSFVVW
jgi:hypothetical protein